VARFAKVGDFGSYCRCVSNGKRSVKATRRMATSTSPGRLSKRQTSPFASCPEAKRFYERNKRKTNTIVAFKALAHKLARACYHMLCDLKPFDVKRCFV
jgi:transposase